VLGGFKSAIQGGLRPVYRRSRFDVGESLLSGPAWAGALAVISARRAALRAWLGEGAARYVVVGALTAGLGIQVSTSASVAQNAGKAHIRPTACAGGRASARGAAGASGLVADLSQLSASADDHRAKDKTAGAAGETASLGAAGGQGWSPPANGAVAASALGERIGLLSNVGMFQLPDGGGVNSGSGAGRSRSEGSTASEPGPASDDDSAAWVSASNDAAPWLQTALPVPVLAEHGSAGPVTLASGLGSGGAPGSTRAFRDGLGAAHSFPGPSVGDGAPADLPAASPSDTSSGRPDVSAPGGVSEPFHTSDLTGKDFGIPSGVPEPSAWTITLLGLALAGGAVRQRRASALPA
jgi:hypothetical protein